MAEALHIPMNPNLAPDDWRQGNKEWIEVFEKNKMGKGPTQAVDDGLRYERVLFALKLRTVHFSSGPPKNRSASFNSSCVDITDLPSMMERNKPLNESYYELVNPKHQVSRRPQSIITNAASPFEDVSSTSCKKRLSAMMALAF